MMIANVLGLLGGAVLLASGIGLLRRRAWARPLAVGYAVFASLFAVVNAVARWRLFSGASTAPADQMQQIATPVGAVGGAAFNLLYNAVLIYFLTRPAVKAHLAPPPER